MAAKTLEERVERLETEFRAVQKLLAGQSSSAEGAKRGWRWFVGIDAGNSHFDNAVRLGQEWRFSDRPADAETD